ncbi:MAG: hypothetical protein ABEH83_04725 [Halobacterium sp.]
MGIVAAAAYAAIAVALVAAGVALYSRGSMDAVPLFDPEAATDPVALARTIGVSLAAFGLVTLAFAAFEAVDETGVVVVAGYGVVVLVIALVTATRTRKYE